MFPTGLNLFPMIECRKNYDLSTGQSRRHVIALFFKILTNTLSRIFLTAAIISQSCYVITSGLNVPLVGIEGLNLVTKFVWSSTLLIHLAFNRSKIRSLVTSVDGLIINEPIIRRRLRSLSVIATICYVIFLIVEVVGIIELLATVGHLHYFRMYSITSLVERLNERGWFQWIREYDANDVRLIEYIFTRYPIMNLITKSIQHWFHLFFMTGSLYTFLALVTFLEVSLSKIYVWKLEKLKGMVKCKIPTSNAMISTTRSLMFTVPTEDSNKMSKEEILEQIMDEIRSTRVKIQEMKIRCDHIFSLPILLSLSILFLDTGIRLSVKQITFQGSEQYMKKYIFWLGIMFHIMKSVAHILMVIFLDNVYEEADSAEVDIVNYIIETGRQDKDNGQENYKSHDWKGRQKNEDIKLLILEMMNNKLHRITAWNMFIVQKPVILAFLGSVIPFAVIIVGFFTPEKNEKIFNP